jgi:ferredoxin-type protein NapG
MSEEKDKDPVQEQERKVDPLVHISRRTFLKNTGVVCVGFFGLGGAGKLIKGEKLLRPPGGQDEADFLSRCLKCDRCRSICPTSVIGLGHISDGILEARTPVMNFHLGYCDYCNKCVEVCPTQALKPFEIQSVEIGTAVVKRDICIAWDRGGCTVCADECPYDAITLDANNHPVVDQDRCNGCGICEYKCPALVLRAYIGGKVRGIVVTPQSQSMNLAQIITSLLDSGGDRV